MLPISRDMLMLPERGAWLRCHKDHDGHTDVYGRLAWDAPSNTITCGCTNVSKGRFVHPTQDRALTPREAAALQGFDDNFIFEADWAAQQIGNAVPPPYAYAIAKALKKQILAYAPKRRKHTPHVQDTTHTVEGRGGKSTEKNLIAFPAPVRRRPAIRRAA